jgi:hypothetical protein
MELHWLKPEGSATGSCQISPGFGMGARPLREQPWIVSEPVAAIEARAKCHNFCEKMSRCLQPSSTAAAGSRCHAAPVRTSIFATGFAIRPARCRGDFKPPASAIATSDGGCERVRLPATTSGSMLELRSRGGIDLLDQRLALPFHLFEIVIDGRILQHVDGASWAATGAASTTVTNRAIDTAFMGWIISPGRRQKYRRRGQFASTLPVRPPSSSTSMRVFSL